MSEIVWQDPPEPRTSNGYVEGSGRKPKWVGILAPLRDHPKRWALIEHFDSPRQAGNIRGFLRQGRAVGVSPGEFEFRARLNADGGSDLYARFVGEA